MTIRHDDTKLDAGDWLRRWDGPSSTPWARLRTNYLGTHRDN